MIIDCNESCVGSFFLSMQWRRFEENINDVANDSLVSVWITPPWFVFPTGATIIGCQMQDPFQCLKSNAFELMSGQPV